MFKVGTKITNRLWSDKPPHIFVVKYATDFYLIAEKIGSINPSIIYKEQWKDWIEFKQTGWVLRANIIPDEPNFDNYGYVKVTY